jgi:hypothetical protein
MDLQELLSKELEYLEDYYSEYAELKAEVSNLQWDAHLDPSKKDIHKLLKTKSDMEVAELRVSQVKAAIERIKNNIDILDRKKVGEVE